MARSAPKTETKKGRRRIAVGIGAAAAAVCAIVFAFGGRSEKSAVPELPPDERFIRETVNSFDPSQSTLQRLVSVQTALLDLKKLPQSRREEVIIEAMAAGVNRNLENFRALPDSEKPARAKLLHEDALQTRKYFRTLLPQERRRARELLGSDASGRAQLDSIVNTVLNEMTSEERAMLNPVFVVWKNMLEEP